MTREEAIKRLKSDIYEYADFTENPNENEFWMAFDMAIKALEAPPNDNWEGYSKRLWKSAYGYGKADAEQRWIPVSEMLPEDLEPVNITWVNHEPEPYYHDIKDKNFVATGIHYRGRWYWYSTTCADYLGEYGSNDIDNVDDAVEIVAWMPLPEPYKAESEEV